MRAEVVRRADQRHVREGLREISELAFRTRVVLFGEQANVVPEREQVLEHLARFVDAAEQREVVYVPEAAREERALAWRQAIFRFLGAIAQHEPVDPEIASDRVERASHARIVR